MAGSDIFMRHGQAPGHGLTRRRLLGCGAASGAAGVAASASVASGALAGGRSNPRFCAPMLQGTKTPPNLGKGYPLPRAGEELGMRAVAATQRYSFRTDRPSTNDAWLAPSPIRS
jgi:hypothetical protein